MSDKAEENDLPAMPEILRNLGTKAIERLERRSATPEIAVTYEDGGWTFDSPYREEDLDAWEALLFDAFATRSIAAFHVFTNQLARLCSTDWHAEQGTWMPNSWELRAAVQTVRSLKPRNEAEACLAAQMVAVHLMQMKLSAQVLSTSYPEPRTCAIAAKLARTYALQLETMAKLKGRGTRQRITVRKFSQHEHKHIHLHQGASKNGNQPHGPGSRERGNKATGKSTRYTSLLGTHEAQHALPMPRDEGEEAVPLARGRTKFGRTSR